MTQREADLVDIEIASLRNEIELLKTDNDNLRTAYRKLSELNKRLNLYFYKYIKVNTIDHLESADEKEFKNYINNYPKELTVHNVNFCTPKIVDYYDKDVVVARGTEVLSESGDVTGYTYEIDKRRNKC